MRTLRRVRPPLAMVLVVGVMLAARGSAAASGSRTIEFQFTPTTHAQLAIWIESVDGTFLKTVGLTQSVGTRGIGTVRGPSR